MIRYMYIFIKGMFLKFFMFTYLIEGLLENTYKVYIGHKSEYIKYGFIVGVFLFSILILASLNKNEYLMITSIWLIFLIIFIPYLIESINLCTNSIFYFVCTILIIFTLVSWSISSYTDSVLDLFKLSKLIYLILCIFFSMISKKDVALIGNEIIGTIATFIYTLIMHYKDNISENAKGLFFNTPIRFELTAKDIQEIEAFDNYITQATSVFLIIIFISVISIMLIHLKDYCNEKYLRHIIEEYDEDKCV